MFLSLNFQYHNRRNCKDYYRPQVLVGLLIVGLLCHVQFLFGFYDFTYFTIFTPTNLNSLLGKPIFMDKQFHLKEKGGFVNTQY